MPTRSLRIIFMGTPTFAVPTLRALFKTDHHVVGVVTATDKPKGRGQQMESSAVKKAAKELNLKVLQPTNLKSAEFQAELKDLKADVQVLVAFRMLPEAVWAMPALGTINLHASLLPQYRGAAPINWAIINGETETGLTTFFLKQQIDTGEILFQEGEHIMPDDNALTLHDRLMYKGADLVVKTVNAISTGQYRAIAQPTSGELKAAPKISKETCEINWNRTRKDVRDFVRGLSPYPGPWTVLSGKTFKIFSVTKSPRGSHGPPGTVDTDQRTYLDVFTSDGPVAIEELQPEGKKRMTAMEFLRGNKL